MTLCFEIPYPPGALSPNARVHWGAKARHAKKARSEAMLVAQSAARQAGFVPSDRLRVHLLFKPTTARIRDRDNALASMKPALDGIASALQVNDAVFEPVVEFAPSDRRRAPCVLVTIEERS